MEDDGLRLFQRATVLDSPPAGPLVPVQPECSVTKHMRRKYAYEECVIIPRSITIVSCNCMQLCLLSTINVLVVIVYILIK